MCDRRASDNRRWFRRRFWVQPGLISNMLKLSYPILQNFFKSAPALLFYRMLQSLPITFCSYPQAMSCHGEAFQKYPWCNRSSSSSSSTALGLVRFERRSPVFLVSFFLFLISYFFLFAFVVVRSLIPPGHRVRRLCSNGRPNMQTQWHSFLFTSYPLRVWLDGLVPKEAWSIRQPLSWHGQWPKM